MSDISLLLPNTVYGKTRAFILYTKAVFKNPRSDYEQICSELTEVEISSDEIELVFLHN